MKALLLLPLALFFSLYAAPEPLSLNPWGWHRPHGRVHTGLVGVTYAIKWAFSFGTRGKILRSSAGETTRPLTDDTIYGIAYGNFEFLAVGDHGLVWTSLSGDTWEAVPRRTTNRLGAVVYANGKWIVAGVRGTILWSTNKYQWNFAVIPADSGEFEATQAVVATEGVLLIGSAPNNEGQREGAVLASIEGTIWQRVTIPRVAPLLDVAAGTNGIVAVGQNGTIITSTNGTTWVNRSVPEDPDWIAVAWGGGTFVTISAEGYGQVSTNGTLWAALGDEVRSLYEPNGRYGDLVFSTEERRFWAFRTDAPMLRTFRTPWNGALINVFPAGNNVALVQGPNGKPYLAQKGPNALFGIVDERVFVPEEFSLNRIDDDLIIHAPGGFYRWSTQWALEPGPDFTSVKIIEANDRYVAITPNGEIHSSTNLTDWERVLSVPDGAFTGLAFENGRFVAAGRESSETGTGPQGFIYSSTDGRTWLKSFSSDVLAIHDLASGDKFFVAVGNDASGAMSLVSSNGLTWEASPRIPQLRFDNVAYGNGLWVASGFDIRPQVFASVDGLNWVKLHCSIDNPINEVAFAGSDFYLLGPRGEILISSPPSKLFEIANSRDPFRPQNEVRITVNLFGSPVELQSSPDLRTWTTEAVPTNSIGAINLYDTATNQARFYRLSTF